MAKLPVLKSTTGSVSGIKLPTSCDIYKLLTESTWGEYNFKTFLKNF